MCYLWVCHKCLFYYVEVLSIHTLVKGNIVIDLNTVFQFLLYNNVNQPYVYIYPLPLGLPLKPHPTPLGYHGALS